MSHITMGIFYPHALSQKMCRFHKLPHHRFLKWFEMPLKAVRLNALVLVGVAQNATMRLILDKPITQSFG